MAAESSGGNKASDLLMQLETFCRGFSTEHLMSLLNSGWEEIGQHLDLKPDILRRVARRCGLPPSLVALCVDWLCNNFDNEGNSVLTRKISQIIKYSVRKFYESHPLDADTEYRERIFQGILTAYKTFNDPEIKTQLTWALGYLLPFLNTETSVPSILKQINVNTNISDQAKDFLFEQIRRKNSERKSIQSICDSNLPNFGNFQLPLSTQRRIGVYVTQSQTAISIRSNHYESEKTKIVILNLFEAFKAKKEGMKNKFVRTDKIPVDANIKSGCDRWWCWDTYNTVNNLLETANIKHIELKDDDINNYLPDKLLGYHWWTWTLSGKPWDQLNVDMTKIILVYSETRPLKNAVIDKLCDCLSVTLSKFSRVSLGSLRYNAIRALYNCNERKAIFVQDPKNSSESKRLEKIRKCREYDNDCDKRNEIMKVVFKILDSCNSEADYIPCFAMALEQLERETDESELKVYLHTIRKHTWDPVRSKELFTREVLDTLGKIVTANGFTMQKRIGCATIIRSYLSFSSSEGTLPPDLLKEMVELLLVAQLNKELLTIIFQSVILGLEKGCKNSEIGMIQLNPIVDTLALCCDNLSEEFSYYAILAISKVINQNGVSVNITNRLLDKLLDETRVVSIEDEIHFKKPEDLDKNENNGISMSLYVADICLKSLKVSNCGHMGGLTIYMLLDCVEQTSDKQTRICVAEILYLCKSKFLHDVTSEDIYDRILELTKDSVADIRILSTAVYTFYLTKYPFNISDETLDYISQLFVSSPLCLGNQDFTDDINSCIIKILFTAASNGCILSETVFDVCNHILNVGISYIDSTLEILEVYSSRFNELPRQTLHALENVLFQDRAKGIFDNCISNGQRVSEKVIDLLVKDIRCDDVNLRSEAFRLLDIADNNQDLSDNNYEILEMERAARIYGPEYTVMQVMGSLEFLLECVKNSRQLTPQNFSAFLQLIGTDTKITVQILKILLSVSENVEPIPDEVISKLTDAINVSSDRSMLPEFCQLILGALKNNQVPSNLKSIKCILEVLLETCNLENESGLFSDIFHIIVNAVKNDSTLTINEPSLKNLLKQILNDKLCRKNFMVILPNIVEDTKSRTLLTLAKNVCYHCIHSKEENVSMYSVLGFSQLALKHTESITMIDSKDIDFLIDFALKSDSVDINIKIIETIAQSNCPLTVHQEANVLSIKTTEPAKDLDYYFERLKTAEYERNYSDVKKHMPCLKNIFSSDNVAIVNDSLALVKRLTMKSLMISLITPDILKAVIELPLLEDDVHSQLMMYEIVNAIVNLPRGKEPGFCPTLSEIETLCKFSKKVTSNAEFFIELIDTIKNNFELVAGGKGKIELTLCFTSGAINTLESIKSIRDKVIEGNSLDVDELNRLTEDMNKLIGDQRIKISAAKRDILLVFAELLSIHLIEGKLDLYELQDSGSDRNLLKLVTYIISHEKELLLGNGTIINGCQLMLKYVATLSCQDMSSYFLLIPSLLSSPIKETSKCRISTAQYILTCIESSNVDIINIYPLFEVIPWLEKGLTDTNNIVRVSCFDSLRLLQSKGRNSDIFNEWVHKELRSFSQMTNIDLSLIESSEITAHILRTICLAKFMNHDVLKNKLYGSVRYEILVREIFLRYANQAKDVSIHTFSTNFLQFSSQEYYKENPEKLCKILEELINSVDLERTHVSTLNNIFVYLNYLDYDTFTVVLSRRKSLCDQLRRKAEFALFSKNMDESIRNEESVNNVVDYVEACNENLDFENIMILLNHIETINCVNTLQALLKFFCENKLYARELPLKICETPIAMLKHLQVYTLTKGISPNVKVKASKLLSELFERGFQFCDLVPLFRPLKLANEFKIESISESVVSILTLIYQFGKESTNEFVDCMHSIYQHMEQYGERDSDWLSNANLIMVKYIFEGNNARASVNDGTGTNVKSLSQIVEELLIENPNILQCFSSNEFLSNEDVIKSIGKIVKEVKLRSKVSVVFANKPYDRLKQCQKSCVNKLIKDWGKPEYNAWASKVQKHPEFFDREDFIIEALAVLLIANYKCYQYYLRDTQILSCLLSLKSYSSNTGKGLLQQVVTGGGKSTIIRILAILLALKGHTIFIATSNCVLAERDALEGRQIMELFNLSVDHNQDRQNYIKGLKACYTKSIVVGDVSQLQFDILRNEYSCLGTLGKWKLDVVIVDEVDNMFVDDSSKFARLSSTIPGMDQLQIIYHYVWKKLTEIQNRVFSIGDRKFLALSSLKLKGGIYSMELLAEDGEIIPVEDLEDFILSGNVTNGICLEIKGDVSEGIADHLSKCLRALLTDEKIDEYELKNEGRVEVPKHLKKFVVGQIPRWVVNSLLAFHYNKDVHYVVHNNCIMPVEFDTTGVVQNATSWSDGLHQFLQIKENLPMTSESLATNYLSTIGFFKRFQPQYRFGFTGTFGSNATKKHISDLYDVNLINIPDSTVKRYFNYKDLLVSSKKEWISAIVESVAFEIKKKRSCLVICRTILEAETIHRILSNAVKCNSIKLYTNNLNNEEKRVEKIGAGEIIVATNLAGRGTDIKTDRTIEINGGLHVCMTFLPPSQRAEDQAIGRTSRLDNLGTSQFIVIGNTQSNDNIRAERDIQEEKILEEFKNKVLQSILMKDLFFTKFCKLLNLVRAKVTEKSMMSKVSSFFGGYVPSIYETNMLGAVEEKWALFIREVEDLPLDSEDERKSVMQQFKKFKSPIKSIFENSDKDKYIEVIESPYYSTCIGNDLVMIGKSEKALTYFNYAIEKDNSFCAAAFVGKAWCLVSPEIKMQFFESSYSEGYKDDAIKSLEAALKLLAIEKSYLAASHTLCMNSNEETGLSKQLLQKSNILGNYICSVENGILAVKRSQRLVDISYKGTNVFSGIEREDHYGRKRKNELDERFNSSSFTIDVTFHDLIVYDRGVGQQNQAIDIINTLPYNCDMQLELTECDSFNALAFFSPHVEHPLKSKTEALALLGVDLSRIGKVKGKLREASKYVWTSSTDCLIDCTFFKSDGSQPTWSQKTKEEIIDKLKTSEDANTKYTLKLYDVNTTFKKFEGQSFGLSLLKVGEAIARKVFQKVDSYTNDGRVTIKIVGKTSDLREYCNNPSLLNRKFKIIRQHKGDIQIIQSMLIIKEHLDELHEDYSCVEICMSAREACNLFESVSMVKFSVDIKCTSLDLDTTRKLLTLHQGQVTLVIDSKKSEFAKEVIPLIQDARFNFSLRFLNCNFQLATKLVKSDCIAIEDVRILKDRIKRLPSLFLQDHDPKEILEFMARGLEYLLTFDEKKFIPWYSIADVSFLGALQVTLGGVLITTGLGAPLGMALVTEGSVDLMIAYRIYSSRNFSWKDYGLQKSVSLVISGCTLGYSAFKSAGQGVSSWLVGFGNEAAEQGVVRILMNGESVCLAAKSSLSSLKSLALKHMGISVAEAAAREVLFQTTNVVSQYVHYHLQDSIQSCVSRSLQFTIAKTSLLDLLTVFCSYKKLINDKLNLKNLVEAYLEDIVNPENNFWKKQWNSIGVMICQGVASSSASLNNPVALGTRLLTMIWGSVEIATMGENLSSNLLKKMKSHEERRFSLVQVIEMHCNVSNDDSRKFAEVIVKEIEGNNPNKMLFRDFVQNCPNISTISNIQLSSFNEMTCYADYGTAVDGSRNKFVKLCKDFKNSLDSKENPFDVHSETVQTIVERVSEQIMDVSHAQLITPVSSYAIGHLVRKVSYYVQSKYIISTNENSSTFNENQKAYDELMNKYLNGESLSAENMDFISNHEHVRANMTVATQIRHNASDFQKAKILMDVSRPLPSKIIDGKNINYTQANYANDIELNGKKAGLMEISHLAEANKCKLILTDDPEDVELQRQKYKDHHFLVYNHKSDSQSTFELYDSQGKLVQVSDNGQSCRGYKFLEHLTGLKEHQLRSQMANSIRNDASMGLKIKAVNLAEKYFGQGAKSNSSESMFSKGVKMFQETVPPGSVNTVANLCTNNNALSSQETVPSYSPPPQTRHQQSSNGFYNLIRFLLIMLFVFLLFKLSFMVLILLFCVPAYFLWARNPRIEEQ